MMNDPCRTIRELLLADADGELDSRRQEEMRAHLAACPACRREYEALACTREALCAWEAPTVNPQLSVAFAERLAARRTRPFDGWRKAAWAAGMAAVLVIGIMSLWDTDREEQAVRVIPPKPRVVIDTPGTEPPTLGTGGAPIVPNTTTAHVPEAPRTHARQPREERRATPPNIANTPSDIPTPIVPDASDAVVAVLAETTPPPNPLPADIPAEKDAALLVVELWGETNQ